MSEEYFDHAAETKEKLNQISPTMCMAKWLQVSMHLPAGLTQSCYHPPTHNIPLDELSENVKALHNTREKVYQRKQMWEGERPSGCQYCWSIEDAPGGPHLSDRHYRSSEWWVQEAWQEVVDGGWDENINPRYVEVNFNQACNFKCVYCSPHLSTEWEKEIKEHGPLHLSDGRSHNNIEHLNNQGLMPIKTSQKENPYVQAFWDWWPTLYRDLRVFRMTGGEPLMDKNTFKVLEYVDQHPNSFLDLSVTSNMCPPRQELFERFLTSLQKIEKVRVWEDPDRFNPDSGNYWYVAPACKHFSLFVSVDAYGKQAEYLRTGLDFDKMLENTRRVLSETQGTEITFINTFNLLSIPSLTQFLQMILDLRVEFGYENQPVEELYPDTNDGFEHPPFVRPRRQRIWFDIPYLHYPDWMTIQLANSDSSILEKLYSALDFMKANQSDEETYGRTYHGFRKHEIAKLARNIGWVESARETMDSTYTWKKQLDFYRYFSEIDRRRGTSFPDTYPELAGWWNECVAANNDVIKVSN